MPKVSVCIPAYNQPELLKKTVASVLEQKYEDYEIIITDDSPDDRVSDMIKTLQPCDNLFYFRNAEPLGSPANWNYCIGKARGEYIKILHHDDFLSDKDSLSGFVSALDENPDAVFAFSRSRVHNVRDNRSAIHAISDERLAEIQNDPLSLITGNSIGAPSSVIYRKKASEEFDVNLKWLVDVDFYIRLLKGNGRAIHIKAPLVVTTDGAQHQVTVICRGNPEIEVKEHCYLFEKYADAKTNHGIYKPFFLKLFYEYGISDTDRLKAYAPFAEKQLAFFMAVIHDLPAYSKKQNLKMKFRSELKSMIKNPVTIFLYKGLTDLKKKSWFRAQLELFRESEKKSVKRFSLDRKDLYPCLDDNTVQTGFDRHYVYHLAWAARIIRETAPAEHTDISSLLYFPTILSAFVKVKYYDYRPADLQLDNLNSEKADLTALPFADHSVHSLSCMHTVEHIGLGRYGDPVDYDGDIKAINELKRVMAAGGSLLFVVPVGQPRIQFNAHRIYSYRQVTGYFNEFELKEFALIPDNNNEGGLIRNASEAQSDRQKYACGCFWFVKK